MSQRSTTPPPTPPTPATPTVGALVNNTPWTGGKRVSGRSTVPPTPFCWRPQDPKEARKTFEKCIQELSVIFNGDSEYPLEQFSINVYKHLQNTGIDAVFY